MRPMTTASASSPGATGPLAGLKVLELGQLIAGPFAGKTLGDFGAEVIKVEPPGTGDPLRHWRHQRLVAGAKPQQAERGAGPAHR